MANKKYDFSAPFLNIDGKPNQNEGFKTLGQALRSFLLNAAFNEKQLKVFGWAQDLNKTCVLEIDQEDAKYLKEWIEKQPNMSLILMGPLLEVFDK